MIGAKELWQQILDIAEQKYDESVYKDLFLPLKPMEIKNNYLIVLTPSSFEKSRLNKLYIKGVNEIIDTLVQDDKINVKFIEANELPEEKTPFGPVQPISSSLYRNNLNANYNFNNFVVGQSNMFAFRIAMKTAEQPGIIGNPLYIFGSVGLGKTHLMVAIGNYILDKDINKRVLYVKASEFIEDYSKMSRTSGMDDFNSKYRDIDVLLIDDIQTLELGQKSQLEFFKVFDILCSANKQIVITSDRPAKELNIMDRLTSRFEVGLTVDIQVPNLEHRTNIIKKKLEESGYESVNEEVCSYIAENFTDNIRELEGAVNRLVQYCAVCELEMNLDTAKEALKALINSSKPMGAMKADKVSEIIGVVADFYKISYDDIVGSKRNGNITLARQIAMYILKTNNGLSYIKIGSFFSGRDHSTVIHAVEKITNELTINPDLQLAINTILKKIK